MMDITQFVDKMRDLSQRSRMVSYLKKYRELAGLSQSELARALCCNVEDLLEM